MDINLRILSNVLHPHTAGKGTTLPDDYANAPSNCIALPAEKQIAAKNILEEYQVDIQS